MGVKDILTKRLLCGHLPQTGGEEWRTEFGSTIPATTMISARKLLPTNATDRRGEQSACVTSGREFEVGSWQRPTDLLISESIMGTPIVTSA